MRKIVLDAMVTHAHRERSPGQPMLNERNDMFTTRIITALAELTDEQAEAMLKAFADAVGWPKGDGTFIPLAFEAIRASHAAWIKTLEVGG